MTRILCVCLGNICRSPLAEAVLSARVRQRGLAIEVDSAGTGRWHVGATPDPRSIAVAAARGLDLTDQRARQLQPEDFDRFALILAMDHGNLATILRRQPAGSAARVELFDPEGRAVPDPYHGGMSGFKAVLDLIEAAADRRLDRLSLG